MKIALITDTHYGIRSDNIFLLEHQKIFFDDVFFPYLEKNKIDTIFHLGDLVDRRKYINYNTFDKLKNDFLCKLNKYAVYIIAGNHDTYYKDRNDLNSLDLILSSYNFDLTTLAPKEITLNNKKILLLPWICKANEKESLEIIKNTDSTICFGHLQLQGFEMHKGSFAEDGLNKNLFEKFKIVCSGHFHHKSTFENINYLGCPYQMNWGDYGDTKGFHIFDTDTYELTFIPNKYSLFYKIEYDDKKLKDSSKIFKQDFSKLKKSFVKIIVKNKSNNFWFDSFIEQIEQQEPLSVQIIEDMGNLAFDGEETDLLQAEDTITILSKYCDNIGVAENLKPKLNQLLQSLYNDANNLRI